MTVPARRHWLAVARLAFVAAVLWFAWWGWRDRGEEVEAALRSTSPLGVAAALALVVVGLALTGPVWDRVLAGYGHDLPARESAAVFFVGQLGKYLPGSVWTMGIQAGLARRHDVPVRTTVAASLVFLGVNVATATGVAGLAEIAAPGQVLVPDWVAWLLVPAAVVGLSPAVVNRCGSWAAGGGSLALRTADLGWICALQVVTWCAYGAGLALLLPPSTLSEAWSDHGWLLVLVVVGAFTAAYVVGVVVVLAPAGLGAREAVLVAALSPATGIGAAASAAVLTRLVHTVADLGLAAVARWRVR